MDIYKISWLDSTTHTDVEIKKPLKEYLTVQYCVGYYREEKNLAIVINAKNDRDKECDFIIIPKCLIIKKTKLHE